jgi:aldehyde dehydrogenase (NAD+)
MESEELNKILESQKRFFAEGKTLDVRYRLEVLKKLRKLIVKNEKEILNALRQDFHKPELNLWQPKQGL